MGDPERAATVLSELKGLGVRLSVDECGTGYSSISRLQQCPVNYPKIDRTFISRMDSDAESRTIVEIIMMLARNLGLMTVAEGTETEDQVNQLRTLGCDLAQGYFFSRPADHKAITECLAKINSASVPPMPTKANTAGAGAT